MQQPTKILISIVIPCYNEADNIEMSHAALSNVAAADTRHIYEFIYVNDGSRDDSLARLQKLAAADPRVNVVSFTRNFGKEMAITAGIRESRGAAVLLIDADGQHPFKMIPDFIAKWKAGARLVVGVRSNTHNSSWKNFTSKSFYRLFNHSSDMQLVPGSTDFRLLDAVVRDDFIKLNEHNRLSRGLIDWLGYPAEYVHFKIADRQAGEAVYSYPKLISLALDSFVSLSLKPLRLMIYSGVAVLALTVVLAFFSILEMLFGDPFGLNITGTAYLVMFALFLLGIILISQGILALYISHIHLETKNRPLYVIDTSTSRRRPQDPRS